MGNGGVIRRFEDLTPNDYIKLSDVPEEDFWKLRYETIDGHKWLITFLPGTEELIAVHPRIGYEFTYGTLAEDVSPPLWKNVPMGRRIGTLLFTYGSVAHWFLMKQREFDEEQDKIGSIYFIQSVDGGPVKIGFARKPKDRLATLQTSHSTRLKILASIQGKRLTDEKALQKKFQHTCITGEWFTLTPELQELIDAANHGEGF